MNQPITEKSEQAINEALREWRQGDITLDLGLEFLHVADVSFPLSPASTKAIDSATNGGNSDMEEIVSVWGEVPGLVILSQTCDVIRDCRERPYVEVAPLVKLDAQKIEEVRRLKRPAYAYIPATARDFLVADLDRTMTVEKSIVTLWERVPGWETDEEIRDFAQALSRKRSRFAFPNDFVHAMRHIQTRFIEKHHRQSAEGAHLRALREIRVRAAPSWNSDRVKLDWWFIKDSEPQGYASDWARWIDSWFALFEQVNRFHAELPIVCTLGDITAQDYVESFPLDLDLLSISR